MSNIRAMDWNIYTEQRIRIYRNLNNGIMSIQAKLGDWRVVGHVKNAVLKDVVFHVAESARQRVIRDRRKNVHAWGEGVLLGEFSEIVCPVVLGYNPYENTNFVDKSTGLPIQKCHYLIVKDNKVFVSDDAASSETKKAPISFTRFMLVAA